MKKLVKLNIGALLTLTFVTYIAYYLLLQDNCLHTSISSILAHSHNLALTEHLLVLGFLPIYIAAMIFGSGVFGAYLGYLLQHIVARSFLKEKKRFPKMLLAKLPAQSVRE